MYKSPHQQIAQQLALAIQLNDAATFEDFCWGKNQLLRQHLNHLSDARQLYLWGEAGSGKSHLLQASCHAHNNAIYLPLKTLHEWGPQILEGLDTHLLVCIDDIDIVAQNRAWEEALFHLYNRLRDNEQSMLLVSGRHALVSLALTLPDLHSRLGWGLTWHLQELTDEEKIHTLQLHAQRRGFDLPSSVGQFLLSRCARNMHELKTLLDRLDTASWIAQRKITIPFVKTTLGL